MPDIVHQGAAVAFAPACGCRLYESAISGLLAYMAARSHIFLLGDTVENQASCGFVVQIRLRP